MIEYIKTELLDPHPNNPRKDIGDIEELCESIQARGILQNLTVVPKEDGRYTVIIGHRRLAAAKAAGIDAVPCAVEKMSEKEQIATMLLENIQRSDLTPYEQAKGFQMMLDLGDTVGEISEQTGFSESTIRRRTKLLELDEDKFKAAEARGGNLLDYIELDKIEDKDKKNELLEKIGTPNFKFLLNEAIRRQEAAKAIEELVRSVSEWAKEVDEIPDNTRWFAGAGVYSNKISIERPDDADEVNYYYLYYNTNLSIYREKTEETKEEKRESLTEEDMKAEAARQERVGRLKAAAKTAQDLRKEFCDFLPPTAVKRHFADIVAYLFYLFATGTFDANEGKFCALLNVEAEEDVTIDQCIHEVSKNPEIRFWQAVCILADDETERYPFTCYRGEYERDEGLMMWYWLLGKLRYEMSEEERKLLYGTHEDYLK